MHRYKARSLHALAGLIFTCVTLLSTTRAWGVVNIDDANATRAFPAMTRPEPDNAYSAVGKIRSDVDAVYANGNADVGTGFLADVSSELGLSQHTVLTAAHVILRPFNWFERDEVGAESVAGLGIRYPGYNGLHDLDVGLLLLDEPVPLTDATPLQLAPSVPPAGTNVAFVGERNGTRVGLGSIGTTWPNNFGGNIIQVDPKLHVAEKGDSGGPILASFGGNNLVVGVSGFLFRRDEFLGFAHDDIVDAHGVPVSWPIYLGAARVDDDSSLNPFVRGNAIYVRGPNEYDPFALQNNRRPTPDQVIFSNVRSTITDDGAPREQGQRALWDKLTR